MVAHWTHNPEVTGSSPVTATNTFNFKTSNMANEKAVVETTNPTAKAQKAPEVISQKYLLRINNARSIAYKIPKGIARDEARVSSEFKVVNGTPTRAIIKGLTPDQERYFCADLINKTPKDPGFEQDLITFWADFSVDVPKQVTLDASYTVKEVELDGKKVTMEIPVNLYEYINANFCKESTRVAFTEEQKLNSDLYELILEDLSVVERNKKARFKDAMAATTAKVKLFSQVSEQDHAKVDWLLDVMKNPNELFYKASFDDKCIRLDELIAEKPDVFLSYVDNPNLESEALLYRLIQLNVVTKEGQAIFFGDMLLGNTQKEAYAFLQDQTKSGFVAKMKAQINDILRK